jgi:hypothetical protein
VRTIVNTVTLPQTDRLCYPARHERVFLVQEMETLARTHIVVRTMHTSNIDTDRFRRRLLH